MYSVTVVFVFETRRSLCYPGHRLHLLSHVCTWTTTNGRRQGHKKQQTRDYNLVKEKKTLSINERLARSWHALSDMTLYGNRQTQRGTVRHTDAATKNNKNTDETPTCFEQQSNQSRLRNAPVCNADLYSSCRTIALFTYLTTPHSAF